MKNTSPATGSRALAVLAVALALFIGLHV